jgi:hypothetical protein
MAAPNGNPASAHLKACLNLFLFGIILIPVGFSLCLVQNPF